MAEAFAANFSDPLGFFQRPNGIFNATNGKAKNPCKFLLRCPRICCEKMQYAFVSGAVHCLIHSPIHSLIHSPIHTLIHIQTDIQTDTLRSFVGLRLWSNVRAPQDY